ncbi:efflux transporter periplasmic adaptor subunit [Opitutaceae bacterium EW11]|nr:efflux transporter periplasmic adaptor subunit [Opitutaceae bacterium EW11]
MIKKFVLSVVGFVAVVAALGFVKAKQIADMQAHAPGMPVLSVSSVEAKLDTWQPILSGIGTLTPIAGASLSTEAEGTVAKISFENGQLVHAGDVLIELDTTVETAQLKSAEAQLVLAKLEFNRANELLQKNTVSQASVDQATAQLNQIEANVAALKALIDRKTVRAPFDGRIGIRAVNIGQFVSRGQPLVPLQKLDQLYVNFTLPERDLPKLQTGDAVHVLVDAFPNQPFEGKLNAISPEVNSSTRNVSLQALIDNPHEVMRPGMFARVEVQLPEGRPLVVVPATAIAYAAYGNSVFIIEQMKGRDGKEYLGVRQQFVQLGDKRGDLVAITDGLKPGEQVVSAGVFKLRNALPVKINNSVQPSAELNPNPANT